MQQVNYGGKQPNNTSYIKTFYNANTGLSNNLWIATNYFTSNVLQPSSNIYDSVYIPGNLYVDGVIVNPTDKHLKENINYINYETSDNIMKLSCIEFTLNNNNQKKLHYGFDAKQMDELFPNLVHITPDNLNYKSINYLEIIPLLVDKIQNMQKEIDELKL
jgi:hypothetical protein